MEEYIYLTPDLIEFYKGQKKYKTERGLNKFLSKKDDEIRRKVEMPDVDVLEIEIEWNRSRTWGMCPRASARWHDKDGWHYEENMAYASGCGYDKESTVVAEVMNKICCGMLYRDKDRISEAPYGIALYQMNTIPTFCGGVGMSCYYSVAKFFGGKLEHVASGKKYDKWVFKFKSDANG